MTGIDHSRINITPNSQPSAPVCPFEDCIRADRELAPFGQWYSLRWNLGVACDAHAISLPCFSNAAQHLLRNAGIARSRSEKRITLPRRDGRMTSFHLPSSKRSACFNIGSGRGRRIRFVVISLTYFFVLFHDRSMCKTFTSAIRRIPR